MLSHEKEEILLINLPSTCDFYPGMLEEMLHLESKVNEMP